MAPGRKPEPFTVIHKLGPAGALAGVRDESTGGGLSRANFSTLEIPAEGDGFCTVTEAYPAATPVSEARIEAVNCVELTNCVTRATLFQ